jgi:predicted thioesterase
MSTYRTAVKLAPGRTATASLVVDDGDTALALRSGDVPVLSTPRLVALGEEATCRVIEGAIDESRTTVAVRVRFDHFAPVRVGSTVTAEAILARVEGRRLTFTISARDGSGLVGAGRVTRVIVDRQAFLAKAR